MTKVRVLIATTEGPSEIQRIVVEDPEVRSVICLNGTSDALPVSSGYDAFIRKPTGIIQQQFGHAVFRMDVSNSFSNGNSWQLGAFTAHTLFDKGQLACKQDSPDRVVWATGEVDSELNVRPVAHVMDKLKRSSQLLGELKTAGIPITILLPQQILAELDGDWFKDQGLDGDAIRIIPVANVGDLSRTLGLDVQTPQPDQKVETTDSQPPTSLSKRHLTMWVGIAMVLVVAVAGVIAWQLGISDWKKMAEEGKYPQLEAAFLEIEHGSSAWQQWLMERFKSDLESQKPSVADFVVMAIEKRHPKGKNCAAVRFGTATTEDATLGFESPGRIDASWISRTCGLEYKLKNSGETVQAGLFVLSNGQIISPASSDALLQQSEPIAQGKSLTLEMASLPKRLVESQTYEVIVVATHSPLDETFKWIASELPFYTVPSDSSEVIQDETMEPEPRRSLRSKKMNLSKRQKSRIRSLDDFSDDNKNLPGTRHDTKEEMDTPQVEEKPQPNHEEPSPADVNWPEFRERLERIGIMVSSTTHQILP